MNLFGKDQMGYLFGPVLSRRLGLSMGVDLLKYKTCNMDCVYCELGTTSCLASCRGRFVPPEQVLREISARRDEPFDHITFAGSGEPTLCRDLGEIVRKAKEMIAAPVAVITNSTLLACPEIRREIAAADVVLPSLDAATEGAFRAINRPASDLRIEKIVQGLKDFRKEFCGEIWLEIFPGAELIPDWDWSVPAKTRERLMDLLSRRPCTLEEICAILEQAGSDAIKYCKILERDGLISRRLHGSELFFHSGCGHQAEIFIS